MPKYKTAKQIEVGDYIGFYLEIVEVKTENKIVIVKDKLGRTHKINPDSIVLEWTE